MDDRRSIARNGALLVVSFAATLLLLAGLAAAYGRFVDGPAASRPPSAAVVDPTASLLPSAPFDPSASIPVAPSVAGSAATPSATGDPVLVGAGDIASCNLDGDEATARLLDGIAGTVFTAGDNAYESGTPEQFAECYDPTWGRHKDRTRPAAGNHEYDTGSAAGYRDYFGDAALNSDGDTWYSYELGTWHVVVLDSNCGRVDGCGPDSDQGRWLEADLAASDARCTVAIWHHPRFSSGEHGNSGEVDPFWRALHAAGADVVVNGHDHDYERFAPQDPDGVEDRDAGIRQFVVGTGGASLRRFPSIAPNSELRVATSPGVIQLTLREGTYDWSWIPTDGGVADSGSARCH